METSTIRRGFFFVIVSRSLNSKREISERIKTYEAINPWENSTVTDEFLMHLFVPELRTEIINNPIKTIVYNFLMGE